METMSDSKRLRTDSSRHQNTRRACRIRLGWNRNLGASEPGEPKPARNRPNWVLQEQGPLHAMFGRYLSTRIDLLSAAACRELSLIPDEAEPTPFSDVEGFVEQDLRVKVDPASLLVEPAPYQTCLHCDMYAALLPGGEEVSIRVLRKEFRRSTLEQMNTLRTLPLTELLEGWTE